MNITIVTRPTQALWGGDLKALQSIKDGLQQLHHQVTFAPIASDIPLDTDFILLTNTCLDLRDNYQWLKQNNKKYGIICFHEDFDRYLRYSYGMHTYLENSLRFDSRKTLESCLQRLIDNPELIRLHSHAHIDASRNFPILRDALFCIANSHFEARTILRDCPQANVKVIYWASGISSEWTQDDNDEFLQFTSLQKKHYILQVGRLELRKNQLSTLLACRDIDLPLVFIATQAEFQEYENTFIEMAQRVRKHPTILVSNHLKTQKQGNLQILQMPNGKKLPLSCLQSAYQNARVHIHPAFYELPGYTYLESVYYNVPTLATEWASIKEYLGLEGGMRCKELVEYVVPYHVDEIRKKTIRLMDVKSERQVLPIFKRTNLEVAKELESLFPCP